MKHLQTLLFLLLPAAVGVTPAAAQTRYRLLGWNDLGMHCVDGNDYSIFSILPPYNNVHAQLIDPSGKLVRNPDGITLTYQAVADPGGSINRTSVGKTNFWAYANRLFKIKLAPDMGMAGYPMPGASNTARRMGFDAAAKMFKAEGVPITPYDDARRKNYYPLMRLVARNSAGTVLATADTVLPVSDEMDCRACHASGSPNTARPNSGWVFDSNPDRDYKWNILALHDSRHSGTRFQQVLAAVGYNSAGLTATAKAGTPVLCARCHLSNALPGTGYGTTKPLTQALHASHARVIDPGTGLVLDSAENRASCYRCHPGAVTACLRGAMGAAVSADGSMLMQCQSCHGNMAAVGAAGRQGWLDQPTCQNCHTGTATNNNGSIRYTSALERSGQRRVAADRTFATMPNVPAAGLSLYRMSAGHGGLQCEACHGATHAEYPSSHRNDNLQAIAFQGHAGTIAECTACHSGKLNTVTGGPHGMHPIGQSWIEGHKGAAERNRAQCRSCHGLDYRGTVLSRTLAARTLRVEDRSRTFPKGTAIGCYNCHNGPSGD